MRATIEATIRGLVVAAALARCGGVSVDQYATEASQTMCAKMYSCCAAAEVQNNPNFGPDQSSCGANVKKQFLSPTRLKQSESQGRLAYHGDRLSDCLQQYKALTCDQLKSNATSVAPACDSFIEPKVAVGASCGVNDECISSWCQGAANGVDGICSAFIAQNGSCADGGVCGKNLYCDGSSRACQPLKGDGTTCNANYECATGGCNGKNPDAGTPGTCGLKGGPNTTCYATVGCSSSGGVVGPLTLLAVLFIVIGITTRHKLKSVRSARR